MGTGTERRLVYGDALVAILLACLLAVAWTFRDWHQLSALRLPDTDDVMRLQQIRDWLAGQRFNDLAQHRLGEALGLAMHWSRLPDLVPGAIIALLTPWLGAHQAEIVAVVTWPTALFAAALFLVARIARAIGGPGVARTAIVVAAIAYPVTTIFLPGRIDHHGLQIVLLLLVVRTLISPPTLGHGLTAGLAAAASLVIGMETAPLLAAAGLAMAGEWLFARHAADDRMMGFGIALGAGLLGASIVFKTTQWGYPGCDGFTATAWRGAVIAAFAPMLMALAARDFTKPAMRAMLAVLVAGVIGAGVIAVAPQCLQPYAMVDPMLARLWLGKVGEAQPLFTAPIGVAIGYAGVMVAGIAATVWRLHATRDTRWIALLIVQLAALGLTCFQLRGAYAGAILAAPALAAVIAAARTRGTPWLAGAWLASAGMLYPLAADALTPRQTARVSSPAAGSCTSPEALATLAKLPPGRLLAPLDLGAYALAASRLDVVGAPYHRNNAGNLAVYRFFLGTPEDAAAIVHKWRVGYVALCPDSFTELGDDAAGGLQLVNQLRAGRHPAWLHPIAVAPAGLALYRVEPGLFTQPATR
jgi:MFS family permease